MGIQHTSKSMKEHLIKKGGAILWCGREITDPKDVPTDEQITAAREAHVASVAKRTKH